MNRFITPLLAAVVVASCGKPSELPAPDIPIDREGLVGAWRAVLTSPGGELPFTLEISDQRERLEAVALNGAEQAPFSAVRIIESEVFLDFEWYDSVIRARLAAPDRLYGEWTKTIPEGSTRMPFEATRGDERRFAAGASSAETDAIAGNWAVELSDEDGTQPARGEFRVEGGRVLGTFLTPTGDYRYLEGSFAGRRLLLSAFDGGHAFLFDAELGDDGTLSGDFWSRETYHATWTGRRLEAAETVLPDPWSLVGLTNDDGRFGFTFPDLQGQPLSLEDPRFEGKVVLVDIFGSWCPNCNDKAPLLAAWHRRYGERGLEIVGLAYEFTGDQERDREQVSRYAERHGIGFPLLLAGISDKTRAAETLPDLSAVIAYPTSVFIGRDGTVRKIHSGFSGPGTGRHYEVLVAELEGLLEELLAE